MTVPPTPPPPPSDRPPTDRPADADAEAEAQYDETRAFPPPAAEVVGPASDQSLAPWWRRGVAWLLDGLVLGAPVGILGSLFDLVETVESADTVRYEPKPALLILSFVVTLAYSALMDGSARGATVGKMAMRIQVRDAYTGGPIGPARAVIRRLIYLLLFYTFIIPGVINALSPLWDARRQGWHDKAVRSVVVNAA